MQADYDACDQKIATIIALGPALAARAALNDTWREAESERIAITARHQKLLSKSAWANAAPDPNAMQRPGEMHERVQWHADERDLRARLDAAESQVFLARRRLDQWSAEFPAISASLRA